MLANAILTSAASEGREGDEDPVRVSQGKVHRRRGTSIFRSGARAHPRVRSINVEGVADARARDGERVHLGKICMLASAWSPEAESERSRSSSASPFRSV